MIARTGLTSHSQCADRQPRLASLGHEEQRSLIKQAELLISYLPYLGGTAWPEVATQAVWGDEVELTGHATTVTPGSDGRLEVEATLFWRAGPQGQAGQPRFTVFLHWRDNHNRMVQQVDFAPYDGRLPTALWAAGGVVRQTRSLVAPAPDENVPYRLVLGIYNSQDGDRLPLRDDQSGEHVLELVRWP
jgi:hypothetical protein